MMYSKEEFIPLFWSENSGFVKGRDPLGIQNSSVTVYTTLLPGMTNLTPRIRYYSFYCWLLSKWQEIVEKENTIKEQYNFIRRGELLLAFIMAHQAKEELSVVGTDYVNQIWLKDNGYGKSLHAVPQTALIKLNWGADLITNKAKDHIIYWKYTSGALGQYYAGALVSLGLIEIHNKSFHLTEEGKKLAEAFAESISAKQQTFFIECIRKGEITVGELAQLEGFCLHKIHPDSTEAYHLEKLLVPSTDSKRKQSITLFLSYRDQSTNEYSFPEWVYRNLPESFQADSALFGWAYYHLNEAFHYALETIFQGFLSGLEGRLIQPQDYIHEIKERILKTPSEYITYNPESSLEEILNEMKTKADLSQILHRVEGGLVKKTMDHFQALQISFELLLVIYKETQHLHGKISEFAIANHIHYQKGHLTEHFKEYINLHLTYEEYIEKTIKILMNDHLVTAYRKMGNGEANLLKFMLEDNVISLVEIMSPVHTTPRLRSLENFLSDLGYLDRGENHKLTSKGNDLLTSLSSAI